MNKPSRQYTLSIVVFLLLCICRGKAENDIFPYALRPGIHEIPAAFTNQFSGITNEMVRRDMIDGFYELPFVKTGIVERVQTGSNVVLNIPLEARFSPPWTNHPVHCVRIQFLEPTGELLPLGSINPDVETQLVSRCRYELQIHANYNTNAAQCYWMAPVQNFGGLAKIPFFDLPNGSNENFPIGTNGWGTAFWVDLDNPDILEWESIQPPEDPD